MQTAPLGADLLTHKHRWVIAVGACFGIVAAAVIAVAALTTWWVLLALIPLVMMAGCMVTMAAMPSMEDLATLGLRGGNAARDGLARRHYRSRAAADPEVGRERTHG